jgi:hypothetical protein
LFIELAEFLRCPEPHQDTFCVVAPEQMTGRSIVRGIVGCPICHHEYAIENGVVRFGAVEAVEAAKAVEADPEAVWALLGITGPGGFVVLVGSAARLAEGLAARMEGVHFVAVNGAPDPRPSPAMSRLTHPNRIPLRDAMARGVVLGAESAAEPWIGEAVRVLLPGLRLVAAAQTLSAPGLELLAAAKGLWVGQKTGKRET